MDQGAFGVGSAMRGARWLVITLGASLALALAGCGGGGGGGDGGGGGAPPAGGGGGGGATGFIPAPPAVGAVLQADATQLLPMRGGQSWHYGGRAGADRFGVIVRSTGGGTSMTLQRESSAPDDDDTVTLSLVGSEIRLTTSLTDLLGAGSGPLSYVLLRSPVRQNDQITLLDQNGLPLNVDLDGDGVGDSADIAAYSRVVGSEAVELPDLQRSLDAVRVDTTLVLRLRRSAAGSLPVERVVQSDWYAVGAGLVRSRVVLADGSVDNDESLIYWDGGAGSGLGMPPPRAVERMGLPAGGSAGRVLGAVRLGPQVLVASVLRRSGAAPELLLNGLDARGLARTATIATGLALPFSLQFGDAGAPPLLALGNRLGVVLQAEYASTLDPVQWRLHRFDADGRSVGPAGGVALADGAVYGRVAAAAAADRWWLAWTTIAGGQVTLWLRSFDAEGVPLGAAEAVRSRPAASSLDTGMLSLSLAVREARLVLSWVDREPSEPARLWLAVRAGAGPLAVRAVPGFDVDEGQPWLAAASDAGQALFWAGAAAPGADDDRLLRGVRIGDDAAPRPSPAGSPDLDAERLQLTPIAGGSSTLFDAGVASAAGGFAAFAVGSAPLVPSFDSFPESFLAWGQWSGDAPLAAGPAATQRFRIGLYPGTGWPGVPSNIGRRIHPVEFDGHWLLIGDDDFGAYATTVFR